MQTFIIVVTVLHAAGNVTTYQPGQCGGTELCGPYKYFSTCQAKAAEARRRAHYYIQPGDKVQVTCRPSEMK